MSWLLGGLIGAAIGASAKNIKDSKDNRMFASMENEEAKILLRRTQNLYDTVKEETTFYLSNYGKTKINVLNTSIVDFYENMEKLSTLGKKLNKGFDDLSNFMPGKVDFNSLRNMSNAAKKYKEQTLLESVASFTGGAAVSNSIALGVGGSSLLTGSALLSSLTVSLGGPALMLFGSISTLKKSEAEYNKALEFYDNVYTLKKQVEALAEEFDLINETVKQMDATLKTLHKALSKQNLLVKNLIAMRGNDIDRYTSQEQEVVVKAVRIAKTIKNVVELEILNEKGVFNKEITNKSIEFAKSISTEHNDKKGDFSIDTTINKRFTGKLVKTEDKFYDRLTGMNHNPIIKICNDIVYWIDLCDTCIVNIKFKDGTIQKINPIKSLKDKYSLSSSYFERYTEIVALDVYLNNFGIVLGGYGQKYQHVLLFEKINNSYSLVEYFEIGELYNSRFYDLYEGIGHPFKPTLSIKDNRVIWGIGERSSAMAVNYLIIDYRKNKIDEFTRLSVSKNSNSNIYNYSHYYDGDVYFLGARDSKIFCSNRTKEVSLKFKYEADSDEKKTWPFDDFPFSLGGIWGSRTGLGDFCLKGNKMYALAQYEWLKEEKPRSLSYLKENQIAIIDMNSGEVTNILKTKSKIKKLFILDNYLCAYEPTDSLIECFDIDNNYACIKCVFEGFYFLPFHTQHMCVDEVSKKIIVLEGEKIYTFE